MLCLKLSNYPSSSRRHHTVSINMAWHYGTDLPPNAFVAGLDASQQNIYIGIASIHECAYPGTLRSSGGKLLVCHDGKVYAIDGPFDVLVDKEDCKYTWVRVKPDDLIPDDALVAIVNENHGPVYIGRMEVRGSHAVGKVHDGVCSVAHNGKVTRRRTFDVLTFKYTGPVCN
ncbi:Hypothetical predicted protein [Cloeon dipterum]|uniref:Uncharacterized protein n=1 Tax=Cloeon dipterum TaxID=197152 RepID=A0A8S1DK88_9INSE|nr:Hypothetical predicted protein [Cloeon dipterum]